MSDENVIGRQTSERKQSMKARGLLTRRVWVVGIAAVALAVPAVASVQGVAEAATVGNNPSVRPDPVAHVDPVRPRAVAAAALPAVAVPAAVAWPQPSVDSVAVPASGEASAGVVHVARAAAAAATAGPAGGSQSVRVQVFPSDAGTSAGLGHAAVVVGLGSTGSGGPLSVRLDLRSLARTLGGDWYGRTSLVELTGCSVTSNTVSGCTGRRPLATHADGQGSLGATVTTAGRSAVTLVAAATSASGTSGSFSATPLSASSSWQAGGPGGSFTWSYPMGLPPVPGDLAPSLAVSYDSGSVDGRVATSNNQPSWLGDGQDLSAGGYIERRFVACSDDMKNGNNTAKTGDLCWRNDNATIALTGHSGPLVKDSGSGGWHLFEDDGSKITHFGTLGASNEYWTLTTTDGTVYTFGKGTPAVGSTATNSAWSVPVFGNQSGEPCYKSGDYAGSVCSDAVWRWNLDSVVDVHGNAVDYFYAKETNHYGENLNKKVVEYDRAGYLTRIEYGLRTDAASTPAAARVTFSTAERCIPTSSFTCAANLLTSANQSHWPDVPFDQICTAALGAVANPSSGGCSTVQAPSFFTRIRLTGVTTEAATGNTTTPYDDVDTWSFGQSFLDPGDVTSKILWTSSISHTGKDGGSLAAPTVTLQAMSTPTANRVDAIGDAAPPINRFRLSSVDNGVGGAISVAYTATDCTPSSKPSDASANTRRCFPVQYTRPGGSSAEVNWFHKYLVARVVESDGVGGQPDVTTAYQYLGSPAWHFDRDDLVDVGKRTWGQWRGYGTVRTFVGGNGSPWTAQETISMRGMDDDCTTTSCSSKRSVSVADSRGGSIADADLDNGFVRETRTFNAGTPTFDANTVVTSSSVGPVVHEQLFTPVLGAVTANDGARQARIRSTSADSARTYRNNGTYTQVDQASTFNAYGMPLSEESATSDAGTTCTRMTYANDTAHWILDAVTSTETVKVGCSATAGNADLLSGSRMLYDGATSWSATPSLTKGEATKVQTLSGPGGNATPTYVTTSTSTYDAVGRATSVTDALGRKTQTTYTPAGAGPVTSVAVKNAAGHTATTTYDRNRGLPLTVTDANGKVTTSAYDALGRLTSVWLPGRATTASANRTFSYTLGSSKAPTVVASGQLRNNGKYTTSYGYYDGQMRSIETQTFSADRVSTARVITQTNYDGRGQAYETLGPVKADGAPGSGLVAASEGTLPVRTTLTFDGAGRAVKSEERAGIGQANWKTYTTTTSYDGDTTTVVPPSGGVPQTTITDSRGRTTILRQYTTPSGTAGASQDTTYAYRPDGLMTSMTDPAGNTWTRSYDLRGRLTSSSDPDSGTSTRTYDDAGQLTSTTDARNTTLAYVYDTLGRKIEEHSGSATGPKLASWAYDIVAKGYLTSSTRYDSSGNAYTRAVASYNDRYQPTETSVTIPASEAGLAGTYTSTSIYNLDGQLATQTQPPILGGKRTGFTIDYDDYGQPDGMSAGTDGVVAGVNYSAYGEPLKISAGEANTGVYTVYSYADGTRRLLNTKVTRDKGTGTVANTAYAYDDAGKLTSIADAPTDTGAGSANSTQCFSYDALAHLTQAWTPGSGGCNQTPSTNLLGGPAPYWYDWSFDARTGNRTSQVSHTASGTTTTAYSYPADGAARPHALSSATATPNAGGVSTTSLGYDAAGNTTSRAVTGQADTSYVWDAEGHLASTTGPSGSTSNVYDADGSLLVSRDGSGKTLYVGNGTEIRYTTATGQQSATYYYSYLGHSAAVRTPDGQLRLVLTDPHSTGEITINDTNQVVGIRRFDPYGNPLGATGIWPGTHGFLDKPTNATTGLTHLGAREYDPTLGRFLSVDPILDLTDPQQWNAYTYANADPVNLADPDGTEPGSWCNTTACTQHDDAMRQGKAKPCSGRCYDNAPYTWVPTPSHVMYLYHAGRYIAKYTPPPPRPKPTPQSSSFFGDVKNFVGGFGNGAYKIGPQLVGDGVGLLPFGWAQTFKQGVDDGRTTLENWYGADTSSSLYKGADTGVQVASMLIPGEGEATAARLGLEGVEAARAAGAAGRAADDLKRFPDFSHLVGADVEDVLNSIPDHWLVDTPRKVPDGIRFSNPKAPGQSVLYEPGWPGGQGVHGGPYLRVSNGSGPPERIPLAGNPAL